MALVQTITEWPCDLCGSITDNQTTSYVVRQRDDGFKVDVSFCIGRYRNGHPSKPATVCVACLALAGQFLERSFALRRAVVHSKGVLELLDAVDEIQDEEKGGEG